MIFKSRKFLYLFYLLNLIASINKTKTTENFLVDSFNQFAINLR